MNEPIMNSKINTRWHIISIISGAILIVISLYFFNKEITLEPDKILALCMFSLVFLAGIIFVLINFNFQNSYVKNSSFMILGAGILAIFLLPAFRKAILFLILVMLTFVVLKFFNRLISTLTTSIFIVFIFLYIFIFLDHFFVKNSFVLFQVVMLSCMVTYRLLGVALNRFFISKLMGESIHNFDFNIMRENLYFIYGCIFIILNMFGLFWGESEVSINILNNLCLSALIIFQVKWSSLLDNNV